MSKGPEAREPATNSLSLGASNAAGTGAVADRADENSTPSSLRHQRLIEIFQRSLQASTKALTFEKLAQCYPYVAEHGQAGLREALNQAMKFWDSSSTREFYAILEERDVATKLAELEQLITEARDRKQRAEQASSAQDDAAAANGVSEDVEMAGCEKQVYIESLTPEDIVKSHLIPVNLKEAEALEGRIQEVQSANRKILQKIESQEKEIDDLFGRITKSLDDLQKAASETDGLPDQAELFNSIDEINSLVER
ncbi:Nnf1-domain-containing protein [Myxozyma melibiosi]|uniref:Nnf1-domain-containing protein n=1 Tax=Myxozyma melibiosi TaxID=54550 RepID=A0ABR1F719_9ASCO